MSRPRIAVLGAGVAGLAAARKLAERCDVVLFDRAERAGGKLVTTSFRGRLLDLGPDNFITRNPAARLLCEELGLGPELLAPATSSAGVAIRGRLRPFPRGLVLGVPTDLSALRRSGIVDAWGVLRSAADLVLPRSRASSALLAQVAGGSPDPTIAELVAPRLGPAVLDALVDPLLGGINAGDSRRLSFAAAAPSIAVPATGGRSLLRALRPRPTSASGESGPLFLGLRDGIASLPDHLVEACTARGVELRLATAVDHLARAAGEQWSIHSNGSSLTVDGVVVALPAFETATVLGAGELARECAAIDYAGVVTVTFAWPDTAVPRRIADELGPPPATDGPATARALLPGSGVLVPRSSGRLVTALSFTSTKWPRSVAPGEVVIRASAGRDGDGRALALDDAALLGAIRRELSELLGIAAEPLDHVVQRWPASFPQYVSGHLQRVGRIRQLAAALPGFALAGAAYDGIGIPACVASGERAASVIDEHLSR